MPAFCFELNEFRGFGTYSGRNLTEGWVHNSAGQKIVGIPSHQRKAERASQGPLKNAEGATTSSLLAGSSGVTRPLRRGSLANYEVGEGGAGKLPASTFLSNAYPSRDSARAVPETCPKAHWEFLGKYLNSLSI